MVEVHTGHRFRGNKGRNSMLRGKEGGWRWVESRADKEMEGRLT